MGEVSLEQVIIAQIEDYLENIHTSVPAYVVRVRDNKGATTLDVQIGISKKLNNGNSLVDEVIEDIPVKWFGGNGFYMTYDIQEGDEVYLHFSMRNALRWKESVGNSVKDAPTVRSHALNDAFATPCYTTYDSSPKVESEALTLGSVETEVLIKKDGTIELGKGATEKLIKGDAFLEKFLSHTHTYTPPSTETPLLTTGVTTEISIQDTIVNAAWEKTLSEVSKTK